MGGSNAKAERDAGSAANRRSSCRTLSIPYQTSTVKDAPLQGSPSIILWYRDARLLWVSCAASSHRYHRLIASPPLVWPNRKWAPNGADARRLLGFSAVLEGTVQDHKAARNGSVPKTAEQRLIELGIQLPTPPQPFGIYAEAVETGNLLFLTGMLPTENQAPAFVGHVGAELDIETGRKAARLAARNALAVARQQLGSLDLVTRVVRLGVAVATVGDVREQAKVADGASELLQDVFGSARNPTRLVYGVASLPLGTPVELELIFEVSR